MNKHDHGDIEKSLTALVPAPTQIDRDQLLYRAGFQAGRRKARPWQIAGGLASFVCCGLIAVALLQQPRAARPEPSPATPSPYVARSTPEAAPLAAGPLLVVASVHRDHQLGEEVLSSPNRVDLDRCSKSSEGPVADDSSPDDRSPTRELLKRDAL